MASTEVATIEPGSFVALNHTIEEIHSALDVNLGQIDVSEFDLTRVGIPAGGATSWEVEDLEGTKSAPEISGIVVHSKTTRAYWPGDYEGGSEPPQCSSHDGQVGVGDPGGECRTCLYAQFGSGKNGAQACKQMMQWFLLQEHSFLPLVVTLPPMSLKPAKKYLIRMAGTGTKYYEVVTTLALEKDKNQGGIAFSKVKPTLGGRLDAAEAEKARSYAEALRPIFAATRIDAPNGAVADAGREA